MGKMRKFPLITYAIRNNLVIVHLFAIFQLMSANSSGCNVGVSSVFVKANKKTKVHFICFILFKYSTFSCTTQHNTSRDNQQKLEKIT